MAHRTTLLLDDETRRAAKELAAHYDCSVSEAIRRAVVRQRDLTRGVSAERQKERVRALEKLYELFSENDAENETRRLADENRNF